MNIKQSSHTTRFISTLKKTLIFTVFLSTSSTLYAQAHIELAKSSLPHIDAEAYILIDVNSGKVLAEKNADVKRDPASLTKMMTSYVISEYINNDKISNTDMVKINASAWAGGNPILKGSSLMFLKPGDLVSVSDLNHGIIIQSGNDACIAMAEYIAGSEEGFVNLMNQYAASLNLTNTHFETVHGLDAPGQFTTARDMASLGKAIYFNHPEDYQIYKEKEFTFNKIRQLNRNGLLWDKTLHVDGMKTGHTNAAGYNLVASAYQDNTRLISVVLGGNTFKGREAESKKLLTWGFRFFETIDAMDADTPMFSKRVWYGKTDKVELGSLDKIVLTIPRGQNDNLDVEYDFNSKEIEAPIKRGDVLGTIRFVIGDETIEERPLVALNDIEKAGFFRSITEYFQHKIYSWFN